LNVSLSVVGTGRSTVRCSATIRPDSRDKPTLLGHRESGADDPLRTLQDSIELEKQVQVDGIIAGFKEAQDALAPNAVLVSVSALFGLTQPVVIDAGSGVLAITHTPNGNNGLTLIDQDGEILKAQRLPQARVFNINGLEYDLTGDLAVMYDVLTTYDELLMFD